MSHDRCYEHKCRACRKCALDEIETLRAELVRAEAEVARLKSYIANGVGGAS